MMPAALMAKTVVKPAPVAPTGPEFPNEIDYLWDWFMQISLGLTPTGFAPPVVTWEAVQAWSLLTECPLEPWEAVALVQLGLIRASIQSEENRRKPQDTPQRQLPATIGNVVPIRRR